jgi:hypothetical protein
MVIVTLAVIFYSSFSASVEGKPVQPFFHLVSEFSVA